MNRHVRFTAGLGLAWQQRAHMLRWHNNVTHRLLSDATLNDGRQFGRDRTPTVFQNFSSCSRHPDKPLYIRN